VGLVSRLTQLNWPGSRGGRAVLMIWQAPQVLAGLGLRLILGARIDRTRRIGMVSVSHVSGFHGGISLGSHVFVDSRTSDRVIRHELGHCVQSRLLGPTYLLVVGLPSILWAALIYPLMRHRLPYDWLFCEGWATRLGKRVVS
jgi:hypothetical protein